MTTRMPTRLGVTMRTQKVFAIAHDLADRFGCTEVTQLQLLLAIVREGQSPAVVVLYNLKVRLDTLERELEAELPAPQNVPVAAHELTWTAGDEEMLERAEREARELGHPYQGCEHLLLAFLRDDPSTPAKVLARHGIRFDNARAEVLRVLGTPRPDLA
jgi:ATP-dependent Clp protease ATP-binding subunit ClpA